jgi:predicted regulator of Ras-like GTPase activity (Roadblock/LC7/MglB family)/CheY-like chemotaxis protein
MENTHTVPNVLIVDDEKSFIQSLLQGLAAYRDDFHTFTANNGKEALVVLEQQKIDLVLTDLKMPEMDGFGLLARMSKQYPKVPVMVMSAYCTPEIKAHLQKFGDFRILEKPIEFQLLVDSVFSELQSVSTGYIRGVTLPAFLQLLEMERTTCTLKIRSNGRSGLLFFRDGALIDAESGSAAAEKAAFDIVCWEDPMIEISYSCSRKDRAIELPLQFVLLEGCRLHDEARYAESSTRASGPPGGEAETVEPTPADREAQWNEAIKNDGDETAQTAVAEPAQPEKHTAVAENTEVKADVNAEEQKREGTMTSTKDILGELAKLQSVETVCLVARDGFLLDSMARSGVDKEMIGAIASSGFGAAASMGRQLDKGEMLITMIEFEKGPVLLAPIGEDAFIVIVADKEANLGLIRLKLKKYSGALAIAAAI